MPRRPGFSQPSPSSEAPCKPTAASAASATCSCSRATMRFQAGRGIARAAIDKPSSTDSDTSTSATTPEARLISHHR